MWRSKGLRTSIDEHTPTGEWALIKERVSDRNKKRLDKEYMEWYDWATSKIGQQLEIGQQHKEETHGDKE